MITRFAPTPSGFLHRGNAVNALLVSWLATAARGTVALRIDDMDAPRLRAAYVDDVFAVLAWLDIDWQVGPRDRTDLETQWSSRLRLGRYRTALEHAVSAGLPVYACTCSRSQQRGPATGGCAGGCRARGVRHEPGSTALRVALPVDTVVTVGDRSVRPADRLGDFVIWRRDDLPAYQLTSVVDDHDLAVTDVVRGIDLLDSTAAQLFLAPFLGAGTFATARFWHHGLVVEADGTKLSKSQQSGGDPLPRTEDERRTIHRLAATVGAPLGIRPVSD
ncbi:MAG: glutamate--tRNA ligase family protein [Candidatus Nanopelagicales bacterium]